MNFYTLIVREENQVQLCSDFVRFGSVSHAKLYNLFINWVSNKLILGTSGKAKHNPSNTIFIAHIYLKILQ